MILCDYTVMSHKCLVMIVRKITFRGYRAGRTREPRGGEDRVDKAAAISRHFIC